MMVTNYWQWFWQLLYMDSILHPLHFNYDAQTNFTVNLQETTMAY